MFRLYKADGSWREGGESEPDDYYAKDLYVKGERSNWYARNSGVSYGSPRWKLVNEREIPELIRGIDLLLEM